MGEINLLTAAEARQIVEDSDYLLKSIFKWIREESKKNNSRLLLCSDCYDESAVEKAIAELKNCGYGITSDEENLYTITW